MVPMQTVLVAAVLVQVAFAFPTEAATPDEGTCVDGILDAIKFMEEMGKELEVFRTYAAFVESKLQECKQGATGEEVTQCENEVKWLSGVSAVNVLQTQIKKAAESRALLTQLASCKSQGLTGSQPQDWKACLYALFDETQELVTQLNGLMQESRTILEVSLPEQEKKCTEAGLREEDCSVKTVLQLRDELYAAINNYLKWKDSALDASNHLELCMAPPAA